MHHLLLPATAFAVAAAATLAVAANPPGKTPKPTCVEHNKACAAACLECFKHCQQAGMAECAAMCEACHHSCLLCATAVGNKLPAAWAACELCEKMCLDCAAACDKHDHPTCKMCAEACRKCAVECATARA